MTDEADADRLQALRDALEREGAELAIVAPKIGGALSRRLGTCDLLGGSVARRMKKIDYAGYRFPPENIHQAIWLYPGFTLSLRDVEDLLAERGIAVSYETIWRGVNYFNPIFAVDELRKRRPKLCTT